MPDPNPNTVDALIERVCRGARIPGRAVRDDLRRELQTHFEEAGATDEAVHRFGAEAIVTTSLRRVYRWDYAALYAAKLAGAAAASCAAALAILALVNLRVEGQADVWRLAPGFSRAIDVALAVVLGLVAAWEAGRRPFSRTRAAAAAAGYVVICALVQRLLAPGVGAFAAAAVLVALGWWCSRLASRLTRWLVTFVAFAAVEYGLHVAISVAIPPARAALAGVVLVAVWASTVGILTRAEHAFLNVFDAAAR